MEELSDTGCQKRESIARCCLQSLSTLSHSEYPDGISSRMRSVGNDQGLSLGASEYEDS